MLVRYWMTPDPRCVTGDTHLSELARLVKEHNLRRFPVIDDDRLRGIITLSDVYRFISKESVHKVDVGQLPVGPLGEHRVAEAMTRNPRTCDLNDPIEQVGETMRRRRIHALPVVHNHRLAGIITESDIMRALATITSLHSDAERIYLRVTGEEKTECLHRIFDLCKKYQAEIVTLLTHPLPQEGGELILLRVRGARVKELMNGLWSNHYRIVYSAPGEDPQ